MVCFADLVDSYVQVDIKLRGVSLDLQHCDTERASSSV